MNPNPRVCVRGVREWVIEGRGGGGEEGKEVEVGSAQVRLDGNGVVAMLPTDVAHQSKLGGVVG